MNLLVWGSNQANLLSNSSSKYITQPTTIPLPYHIVSICASEKHISFVTHDGILYSYGSNLDGRLGVSSKKIAQTNYQQPVQVNLRARVIRIQAGFSHMCVLLDNAQMYSWGLGQYGALGTGEYRSTSVPNKVSLAPSVVAQITQISCGAMHTAFLTRQGDLYMCGSNEYGELGFSKPQKVPTPTVLSFHVQVTQVSCGVFYTLILTKEGKVYGMGNNKYGQLGIGHKVNECYPTVIRQLQSIVKVTAGYHSGAIDKFGNIYIWGSGSFGEFVRPRKFVLSTPIKDISIRGFFGIAIGQNSKGQVKVYSWGNNTFGQLGNGRTQASKQPIQIEQLRGVQIGKIALGVNFVVMLTKGNGKNKHSNNSINVNDMSYNNISRCSSFSLNSQIRQDNANRSKQKYNKGAKYSPISKNYEVLFTNLSQDYEILLEKYTFLENKLKQISKQQQNTYILRQEISLLNNRLIKKESQVRQLKQQEHNPYHNNNRHILSQQVQKQYSQIITKKEHMIHKLSLANNTMEEEYMATINKLREQNRTMQEKYISQTHKYDHIAVHQNQLIAKMQMECLHKQKQVQDLKSRVVKANQQKQFIIRTSNNELLAKLQKLEIQCNYEKEFNRKYNESIKELQQTNQKLHQQLTVVSEQHRIKEQKLRTQADKSKRYKKQLDNCNIELEQALQKYNNLVTKSNNINKQKLNMKQNTQKECKQLTSKLQAIEDQCHKLKECNRKLQSQMNKCKQETSDLKHQIALKDAQLQHKQENKAKLQKKLAYITKQLNKQVEERQEIVNEIGEVKREMGKLKIANGQLQKNMMICNSEKQNIRNQNEQLQQSNVKVKEEMVKMNEKCENISKQNNIYREQLFETSQKLQELCKVNDELEKANKQFAQNQKHFHIKISQLQQKMQELQVQNKAYTPRYEALLIRNKELDERNRQLGQMVNKAIQMQASTYKKNIMKEVQFGTQKILNNYEDEQKYQEERKIRRLRSQEIERVNINKKQDLSFEEQEYETPKLREQPFKKMVRSRISEHKQKVSQSALKLANILDMEQVKNTKSEHDYQKINSQIQVLSNQKKEFMSKINSFAQKLKIL